MAYDFFSEKMVDEKKNIRKLGENKKQIGLPGFLVTPNSWILSRWWFLSPSDQLPRSRTSVVRWKESFDIYHLVMTNIAMENHHF